MVDPLDTVTNTALMGELSLVTKGVSFQSTASDFVLNSRIIKIINTVFYSIISITMFLCFFSLSASMAANLYEQKKEIGVLRAIGITKIRIKLLYFYEAMILVISSCILGVLIGVMVGYTMSLQQNLVLHMKLVFFFPW